MRKAKDIVRILDLEFDCEDNREYYTNIIINSFKQAQLETIEETVKMCAENAYVEYVDLTSNEIFDYTDIIIDDNVAAQVNKQSILNIAEKLKKEINE